MNRARQQLWRYYPQLLKVESDLTKAWVCELWCLTPTPEKTQREVDILSSLPSVGRFVLATLLAVVYDPPRWRDYQALRCLSGVAPVTKRSGKSLIVIRRLASHNRLRDAVYHWAV